MVVHICNPRTREVKTKGRIAKSEASLHYKCYFKCLKRKKEKKLKVKWKQTG
jgi:hypothetical protein